MTHDLWSGALSQAAVEGDADYLELLILNGMLPNSTDYNERTPLHLAASHGHVHIVRYLCKLPVRSWPLHVHSVPCSITSRQFHVAGMLMLAGTGICIFPAYSYMHLGYAINQHWCIWQALV